MRSDHTGPEFDVAIVGAGAAGLAASAVLRAAGRRCILIEAGDRIGGRAHTLHPALLGGACFDTGATWLHAAERNPLVALARRRGIALEPAFRGGRRLLVAGRTASDAEQAAYESSRAAWEALVTARAGGPDCTLAEAGSARAGDPWTASIENWDGAIIAAADAGELSLHDWHRNVLDDDNLSPPDGVGTLLETLLGPLAGPARLATPVRGIAWGGTGCVLRCDGACLTARAVIVTVSTGVLRSGRIAFEPELPPDILDAIDGLPMGLLSKLALPAAAPVGAIEDDTLVERQVPERGDPGMLVSVRPHGLGYVAGFFGGRHAWSLADRPEAALAEARAILREADSDAEPGAGGLVTGWGTDPLFGGAYAYCRPGRAGSRAALSRPLCDGRLSFAGEACRADGLAGTVGGAMLDGERAAQAVLRCIIGLDSVPSLAALG